MFEAKKANILIAKVDLIIKNPCFSLKNDPQSQKYQGTVKNQLGAVQN